MEALLFVTGMSNILRIGHVAEIPDFVSWEQQRRGSACSSAQSNQRFRFSFSLNTVNAEFQYSSYVAV